MLMCECKHAASLWTPARMRCRSHTICTPDPAAQLAALMGARGLPHRRHSSTENSENMSGCSSLPDLMGDHFSLR